LAKTQVRKVVVYCVRDETLLVFRHVDYSWEEVGLQVPAGSIEAHESVEAAGLRELREETGRDCFAIDRVLGVTHYDIWPYRDEIQERHFVLAHPTAELPDRWIGHENHCDQEASIRFEFFWLPLRNGHVLQAGQGAMLWRLAR
jgi:8-oxo-dGTP pyrophosphatase MutT (NUDIX family)